MQCAAVSTWRGPTKEPPHQNSVRREPCKKMAAIQGHRPGRDSSPPTTRKAGTSGWPHSADIHQCPSLPLTSQLHMTMSAANRTCSVTCKMSHLLAARCRLAQSSSCTIYTLILQIVTTASGVGGGEEIDSCWPGYKIKIKIKKEINIPNINISNYNYLKNQFSI